MKRVLVLGSPGSGKSTFARRLQAKTGLPLVYLDCLFWNSDKTTVSADVFLKRLNSVLEKPEWIIDGDYISTQPQRLAACDTVFLLDYPFEVCLDGIYARSGKSRPDLPWKETADEEFIAYVRRWHDERRAEKLRALLLQMPEKRAHIFASRDEADIWLNKL